MSVGALPNLAGGFIVGPACPSCAGGAPSRSPQRDLDYAPALTAWGVASGCNSGGGDGGGNGGAPSCGCGSGGGTGGGVCPGGGVQPLESDRFFVAGGLCTFPPGRYPEEPLYQVAERGLCPPPPGTQPPAVPGPGAPYRQGVKVFWNLGMSVPAIAGLAITCKQTGVTFVSTCDGVTFYHSDSYVAYYSTPGGPGSVCDGSGDDVFQPNFTTAPVPSQPVAAIYTSP